MSERAEKVMAAVMSAIYAGTGVTKGARVSGQLQVVEGVVRGLVDAYETQISRFEEHTAYVTKVLKAIERPEVPYQVVPFRAGEWRVGLTPNTAAPEQRLNGHHRPLQEES